ncbi:sushi, von Willebrand factor type A, EGF and pentraxin domain-containing protein 1-like [Branchiostoma floridae x Branchiostoma belcheri]
MSSSPGSPKQLPRGRSTHGPTKTAWTTRYDHLRPRGFLTGRTWSRQHKPKQEAVAKVWTEDFGKRPIRKTCAERSFMWRDFKIPEDRQELSESGATPDIITGSEDEDITRDTAQHQDRDDDDQCDTVEEKDPPFEEESNSQEVEHSVSVDSGEKRVPLKRQPSSDSLFGGKQVKPGAVWRPYGPPLYGYGSSLNPPPRKRPDTLLILAAIFYCLAVLTAVVFAVLFKTNVIPVYKTPEPVPVWMQQFSPEMQKWYQLALQAAGGDTSAILPPGYVPQPTDETPVQEFCRNTSLPDLPHGHFNCTSIAHHNIYVRMCIAKCDVGYQTDDAGLLFCKRGRWAPIAPEVVSTLVGVGRAADTMPNTDPRWFEYLGISDQIYADVAFNILVKVDDVPNLSIIKTYLNIISEDNIIDFNMMRQVLIWIGPTLDDKVANLDFLHILSRLETFGASRRPVCRIVDCGGDFENLAHGRVNSTATTYMSEGRVVCERGYLPQHPVLTCNATGHWDKPAQCDPVTCSPPEDPPHGSYLCPVHVLFSDCCDVTCDEGYVPETDHALGCSWTGNWTAFRRGNTTEMENAVSADVVIPHTLACVIADCGNISTPAHGDVTCTGTTYGETCHLTCQDGYERLGQDNFTCLFYRDTAQASWSGEPECTPVSCGSPPEFPNTALQCASGHTYGNTCGVTCADGYRGTNHQSVACHSSGNWSLQTGALQLVVGGPDLFCQKKDCGNLTSPANGSLTCSGTRYQDSCRLTCEPGYKVGNEQDLHLHSLHSFRCMATGQWNDKPRCVPSDYCRLSLHDCHPEHGICDMTGHQTFSCRCRVGTVGDGRRCERTSCPPFPVAEPENGYFGCSIPASPTADFCQSPDSTAAEYEVVCLLHCNPGYDRLVYAEYSCGHDGNWTIPFNLNTTGTIPCLAVKCSNLSSPLHGRMTCDSRYYFRYPEVCNFTCDRGYELTTPASSRERRCQTDATWSGNDAVCIGVKCPDLSAPPNGRMVCNTSSLRYPDSTCTFSCNYGYELATERERHCQANATWSGDETTCIGVRCPTLSAPANGVMTCNRGSSFRHPETCTFTCNHGYQLYTGSSSRTCQADGAWNGTSPSCRACPSGYIYRRTNRLCYKAYNLERDYNGARAICSSDGGTLAMPRDAATNTFLINLKNAVDKNAFFRFGLTDIQQEGRWVWEDGAALGGFSSWESGQPDNEGGNEDCAEYASDKYAPARNKWNDIPCSRKFGFICQVG